MVSVVPWHSHPIVQHGARSKGTAERPAESTGPDGRRPTEAPSPGGCDRPAGDAAPGILRAMRLQPNPPRLVTVGIALLLGAVGLVYAWPIDGLASILDPVTEPAGDVGLTMDRELGFLCLFACPSLLVIGSLLPGI